MNYHSIEQALRAGDAARTVPDLCRRTLAEIVAGRRRLAGVRHPLGFVCLPVQRQGDYGVCVHVWAPQLARAQPTTSAIHSHSWDLLSFVLYGAVGNVRLGVVDDPAGATHRLYEVYSGPGFDELRATQRLVRCFERGREEARAGGTYRLAAGEFHESVLIGSPEAATVVLGRGGGGVDLSLGPPATPTHRIPRQQCGAQDTARAARIVLDRLWPAVHAEAGELE
jgi:hypothetical protein